MASLLGRPFCHPLARLFGLWSPSRGISRTYHRTRQRLNPLGPMNRLDQPRDGSYGSDEQVPRKTAKLSPQGARVHHSSYRMVASLSLIEAPDCCLTRESITRMRRCCSEMGTGMCTSALMTYITWRALLRTYCFRGREWGRRKQAQASARTQSSSSELLFQHCQGRLRKSAYSQCDIGSDQLLLVESQELLTREVVVFQVVIQPGDPGLAYTRVFGRRMCSSGPWHQSKEDAGASVE